MKYDLKSLTPFTWCPMAGRGPALVDKCRECENLIKVIKLRDASDNIPLPSYVVRCRYPEAREIYELDGEEVVSCAKLKYNPYVAVPECERCNFFVKRIKRKVNLFVRLIMAIMGRPEQAKILCSVPTRRTVAYKWKGFKAMEGGNES